MTTYSTISNASVAVGAIPSSTTVTALRDNPIAISEASSGAPVMVSGWHPVDKVTIGDGKAGLIYDSSTTGIVASVITPDFVDGYEYRIFADNLSHDNASAQSIIVEFYHEPAGSYVIYANVGNFSAANQTSFDAQPLLPRVGKNANFLNWFYRFGSSVVSAVEMQVTGSVQKILRARIRFSAGSIDNGKIYLMRRREYISSP